MIVQFWILGHMCQPTLVSDYASFNICLHHLNISWSYLSLAWSSQQKTVLRSETTIWIIFYYWTFIKGSKEPPTQWNTQHDRGNVFLVIIQYSYNRFVSLIAESIILTRLKVSYRKITGPEVIDCVTSPAMKQDLYPHDATIWSIPPPARGEGTRSTPTFSSNCCSHIQVVGSSWIGLKQDQIR